MKQTPYTRWLKRKADIDMCQVDLLPDGATYVVELGERWACIEWTKQGWRHVSANGAPIAVGVSEEDFVKYVTRLKEASDDAE